MKILIFGLLVLIYVSVKADSFEDKYVAVFIDSTTEEKLGSLPLDRSLFAKAIERLKSANAKGVILKFFLDLPKEKLSDKQLADSIKGFPVVLQARIENGEVNPNLLPKKFTLSGKLKASITGRSGWIPTPQFLENAKDVCFIDFEGFPLPALEKYKENGVKSLFLCALELGVNQSAKFAFGRKVEIAHLSYDLDSLNRFSTVVPPSKEFEYIRFSDIFENENYAGKVRGKVVIIGYTGPKIHNIKTEFGGIPAHEYFVRLLHSLYESGI
ncbi:MAG: CHASE2 domain-containing protein [Gammaproteobacteria bacterium]|nr:CHASE2 domain-containing protein [Gammaproteobacteria bacterium]